MEKRITTASEAEAAIAQTALDIQDAVNLYAIVGQFHKALGQLKEVGFFGVDLISHPVTLAYISKLISLCQVDGAAEGRGIRLSMDIAAGEVVEYPVRSEF